MRRSVPEKSLFSESFCPSLSLSPSPITLDFYMYITTSRTLSTRGFFFFFAGFYNYGNGDLNSEKNSLSILVIQIWWVCADIAGSQQLYGFLEM